MQRGRRHAVEQMRGDSENEGVHQNCRHRGVEVRAKGAGVHTSTDACLDAHPVLRTTCRDDATGGDVIVTARADGPARAPRLVPSPKLNSNSSLARQTMASWDSLPSAGRKSASANTGSSASVDR
ncbi:hypothetical protein GCM10009670_10180 [Citricoccus alkalitolerans]